MKAEDLKNSILQLAMEGKLVPQDSNDEPASVLLEKIHDEKEKLIKNINFPSDITPKCLEHRIVFHHQYKLVHLSYQSFHKNVHFF